MQASHSLLGNLNVSDDRAVKEIDEAAAGWSEYFRQNLPLVRKLAKEHGLTDEAALRMMQLRFASMTQAALEKLVLLQTHRVMGARNLDRIVLPD